MNAVFCALMLSGLGFAICTGRAEEAQRALLAGGQEALALFVQLAGAYALFGGLLEVLKESGAADGLARALRKPMQRLFSFEKGEEEALPDICLNLSANMLGMGGAATAAGLSAMKKLAEASGNREEAGRSMVLFLVINTSSVQLFPASMVALRTQAGAVQPEAVVLPALLATAFSTFCGVLLCRAFLYRGHA